MADWVWVESPGTSLREDPRVRAAQFGDGYQQRAPDGLNPLAQVWQYLAKDVDDAVAADMVAFLRAQNGVTAFNYVPRWQTVALRFICQTWTRTVGSALGTSDINATFEQVFEP